MSPAAFGLVFLLLCAAVACAHKADVSSSIENAPQTSEPAVVFRARARAAKPVECLEVGRETWCKTQGEQ